VRWSSARLALGLCLTVCFLVVILQARIQQVRSLIGALHEKGMQLEVERSWLEREILERTSLAVLRTRLQQLHEQGRD
jgi:hypothetical protein